MFFRHLTRVRFPYRVPYSSLAQWLERLLYTERAVGSNPTGATTYARYGLIYPKGNIWPKYGVYSGEVTTLPCEGRDTGALPVRHPKSGLMVNRLSHVLVKDEWRVQLSLGPPNYILTSYKEVT